jgi:hypothetical protein
MGGIEAQSISLKINSFIEAPFCTANGNWLALLSASVEAALKGCPGLPKELFPHEREIQSYRSAGRRDAGLQLWLRHQELCTQAV